MIMLLHASARFFIGPTLNVTEYILKDYTFSFLTEGASDYGLKDELKL